MKRIMILVATAALLAACGDDTPIDTGTTDDTERHPTVFETEIDAAGTMSNAKFAHITVDGIECIVYHDHGDQDWAYSGLSCDWGEDNGPAPAPG